VPLGLSYSLGKGAKPFEMSNFKLNIMQHYLETLNALTTDYIIDINDYYAIGLSSGVQLQAKYSYELIAKFNSMELELFDKDIEDNGFISIEFKYNGDFVTVTLT
jgi:hypothetical protein